MRRFAVGDLQGHLKPLQQLLDHVSFDPKHDELWVVGDLVNRGPDNVAVLRFLKALPNLRAVLGNHDLHLLAVAAGVRELRSRKDTIEDVLQSPDRDELLQWLRHRPMAYVDSQNRQVMTHAGIPPCWTVEQTQIHAREVETVLRDQEQYTRFLADMYGNQPDLWTPSLRGPDRLRVITNYLTRMRFVTPFSQLEFNHSGLPEDAPKGFLPWFDVRDADGWQIVFGHWAALQGKTGTLDRLGLDTGYGWGGWLTLTDLDAAAAGEPVFYQLHHDGTLRERMTL